MVNNEVNVEETNVETTKENKFEVPESFKEKFKDNPEKAIEQLYKAQHTIVEQKKAEKQEEPAETKGLSVEEMEKFYAEKKFFESNPELQEHENKIKEFTSKGYTLEHAKMAVLNDDPTIQNRAIAQKTNFTAGESGFEKTSYSQEEVANLPFDERKKIMDKFLKQEIEIK